MSKPCQPTKKLNKGGVLRKRRTSSLARFNHSCVRNALLEMVRVSLKLKRGCAYANGVFVAAEDLDIFRLGVVATGGRLSHQATCPLWKGFWLMAVWGLNPEVLWSLWLMASATWGGNHFSWRPPWLGKPGRAPSELYPGICLRTEERHGKPQSG
jgi:hypothetical protein